MRINLKDFRQSHNLYQSDMAELLQVNQSNVSRAEIRGFFDLTYPQKKALYEKFGFENAGTRKDFYTNPADNAVIYWLR